MMRLIEQQLKCSFYAMLLVGNLCLSAAVFSQSPASYIYKTVDSVALDLEVYFPPDRIRGKQYPAMVFFFGGGWVGGSKDQFRPHSEFFARRGMVCIVVSYRVRSRHNTPPTDAIQDARDAMRWVKGNAGMLGIDPNRIIASGGSAGGHLALCTATVAGFDPPRSGIDPTPSALILFNPVVNTTHAGYGAAKLGADSLRASPFHQLRRGLPPMMIFHGTEDTVVPFENIVDFEKRMQAYGNVSAFPGKGHGFFNKGRGDGLDYLKTLVRADKFIRLLGYL